VPCCFRLPACIVLALPGLCVATASGAAGTERASLDSAGVEGDNDSFYAAISPNGRYVAFVSRAANLLPGGAATYADSDVFVHDRKTAVTTRVSLATDGTEGDQDSFAPTISANGRIVAFEGDDENLVADDDNGMGDTFAHDRKRGVTERLSVDGAGAQVDGGSYLPAISANGRFVAFESNADALVESDGNLAIDVFVRDRK
jgi:Tol biopolymer transport system component